MYEKFSSGTINPKEHANKKYLHNLAVQKKMFKLIYSQRVPLFSAIHACIFNNSFIINLNHCSVDLHYL